MENCKIAVVLATAENIKNIERACICMMFDRILISSYARASKRKANKKLRKKVSSIPSESNNAITHTNRVLSRTKCN